MLRYSLVVLWTKLELSDNWEKWGLWMVQIQQNCHQTQSKLSAQHVGNQEICLWIFYSWSPVCKRGQMELLRGGAINFMLCVSAVHTSSRRRVCTGRAASSFLLRALEMQKTCLARGLLLVASHKAGFRWPLLPRHVVNAAHSSWTERTSVFIRGI